MARVQVLAALLLAVAPSSFAENAKPFDAAAAFGALPTVSNLSLSPDGKSVSYVIPTTGQGSGLIIYDLNSGKPPQPALRVDGKPDRLSGCHWVSNQRIVCLIYGVTNVHHELHNFTRVVAVNRDATNIQVLNKDTGPNSAYTILTGGSVIDWLPDEDGAVLMSRYYAPGSYHWKLLRSPSGFAVDRVDTRTLQAQPVETPEEHTFAYWTDNRGTVRVMGRVSVPWTGQFLGELSYLYRKPDSQEWLPLTSSNSLDNSGFFPLAVDYEQDLVYGRKKKEGRFALYTIALDGSHQETLIYANDEVDVHDLIRLGRRNRVVGVSYVTDRPYAIYFDPEMAKVSKSLARALPQYSKTYIVDSSVDEQVLLIYASRDDDPGVYYVFDRRSKELHTFLIVRNELEGVTLAKVTSITYPAADGTPIPGYLTLPPGAEIQKGLPAIVLPHGGPSARDEWGFNWMAQFYAARGFAVLQPNYRGSTGYGEGWLRENGFKSWRISIGDVLDAGHWLVSQGIADPAKLAIVGWSYGGYAALQSAVMEPGLFKAVVATAPVTDLEMLKNEQARVSGYQYMNRFIGEGPLVKEGSPALNAAKIKVPVIIFHGAADRNVDIAQSKSMISHLKESGANPEFVTWDDLDHRLEDPAARALMLRKSEAFINQAFAAVH